MRRCSPARHAGSDFPAAILKTSLPVSVGRFLANLLDLGSQCVSAREVASRPITTLLSGPAAGALGAALLANVAGFERVLTLDGGGTNAPRAPRASRAVFPA